MSNDLAKLPGDYIAGLVDGEGCFWLSFARDHKNNRSGNSDYFYWKIGFSINMRRDERRLLEMVRTTLGAGELYFVRNNVLFQVHKRRELEEVVKPFFREHQLHGKKVEDLKLWVEALEILSRHRGGGPGRSRPTEDTERLLAIRSAMRKFKARKDNDYKYRPDPSVLGLQRVRLIP